MHANPQVEVFIVMTSLFCIWEPASQKVPTFVNLCAEHSWCCYTSCYASSSVSYEGERLLIPKAIALMITICKVGESVPEMKRANC